jgi:hypothetical protein
MTASIFGKAREMHHVPAFQTTQRIRRLKQAFMTNRTASLQFLRDAVVVSVGKRNASIAPHTMAKVNAKAKAKSTCIAIRAMKDGARSIIIQMANATKVFGKGLASRFTVRIDASIFGWL